MTDYLERNYPPSDPETKLADINPILEEILTLEDLKQECSMFDQDYVKILKFLLLHKDILHNILYLIQQNYLEDINCGCETADLEQNDNNELLPRTRGKDCPWRLLLYER